VGRLSVFVFGGVLACTPTFNWRSVQVADFGLTALWPCKPDSAQRPVSLASRQIALHMLSCDAAGQTFAWGAVRVPVDLPIDELAQAWQHASLSSIKATPAQATAWTPAVRAGMSALGWRAPGLRHDGSAVTAHAVVVRHRDELHQLVIYGHPTPAILTTWIEGIEAKRP
jgi:hypothetical protein